MEDEDDDDDDDDDEDDDDDDDDGDGDDDGLRTLRRSIIFWTSMCNYIKKSSVGLLYHWDYIIFQYTYSIVTADISYWYSQWLSILYYIIRSLRSTSEIPIKHVPPPISSHPRVTSATLSASEGTSRARSGCAQSRSCRSGRSAMGGNGSKRYLRCATCHVRRDGNVRWISHGEQGLVTVPWLGNIGHHLIVAIIDNIPNGWVMFNGDISWPMVNIGE